VYQYRSIAIPAPFFIFRPAKLHHLTLLWVPKNSRQDGESSGPHESLSAVFHKVLPGKLQLNALNPAVTLLRPAKIMKQGAHHLKYIFVQPLDWNTSNEPPITHKTQAEKIFLRKALQSNFVFNGLLHRSLFPLIEAFEMVNIIKGSVIIEQGDAGDYFYALSQGECSFLVDGKDVGKAVTGDSFGELALLYTAPRAATVKAVADSILNRVDQKSFRFIFRQQTVHNEQAQLALLTQVPLKRLADAMVPRGFIKGEVFLKGGESFNYFFVVQQGRIQATDITIGGASYEDMLLEPGSYGGGHVILMEAERKATATALSVGLMFVIAKTPLETSWASIRTWWFDSITRSNWYVVCVVVVVVFVVLENVAMVEAEIG
jgi:CRP-like cAMP-binding protein